MPEKVRMSHTRSMTNSYGDVWATAWADDDLLYTVSDDTHGFDESCNSNLAISVLSGDQVQDLRGRTVNPMKEYGACNEEGPDGATWKANGLTCVDGVLYLSAAVAPVRGSGRPPFRMPGMAVLSNLTITVNHGLQQLLSRGPCSPGGRS